MDMLTSAIIGHLVGDYLMQNDWMALNKKASTLICLCHCVVWATCVCVFSNTWWWWIALVATHFIQDRTTIVTKWMDTIGQTAFRTGPYAPWSAIVVDNVWHIVTIYGLLLVGEV